MLFVAVFLCMYMCVCYTSVMLLVAVFVCVCVCLLQFEMRAEDSEEPVQATSSTACQSIVLRAINKARYEISVSLRTVRLHGRITN